MINVEQLVTDAFSAKGVLRKYFSRPVIGLLRAILHEKEFVAFAEKHPGISGFDFVDKSLEYLDFSYYIDAKELARIPTAGRVVLISNHPVGSLDGLAFLQLVHGIRPDVKILANQILGKLGPLAPMLLMVDNMGGSTARLQFKAIKKHLSQEGAVIVFPSGVVSRWSRKGIKDGAWHSGFLKFSQATRAPILPVYIEGRNSIFFYLLSLVARKISTLWLVPEMFKHRGKSLEFRIGNIIPCKSYENMALDQSQLLERFKAAVYALATDKQPLFPAYEAVAPAEDRHLLAAEVKKSALIGATADGKQIYLYQHDTGSSVMNELGRLRELTFRMVEEGTGQRRDLDKYDEYYMHLLLWDDQNQEIVGAYRIFDTSSILTTQGPEILYSSLIYKYKDNMKPYFKQGMELGRSFVQPKYWGKRSLDYLWYGIGALVSKNPNYRYLFGAVSLSDGYPQEAKDMIVHFYARHFPAKETTVEALHPYKISESRLPELESMFPGEDYSAEFTLLKKRLKKLDCTIPTLYKQYAELGEPGGVAICASGLDVTFSNAIDGFVMVDVWKLKPAKRMRYIQNPVSLQNQNPATG